jgi:hypothetical protein
MEYPEESYKEISELMSLDADGLYKKLQEYEGLEETELSEKLRLTSVDQGQNES